MNRYLRPQKAAASETAVLGGGCFWCLEAVFERAEGIVSAVSGYAGGTRENPTYEQVSTGLTGHAEVVRIDYDPQKTSYEQILDLFFKAHDPTTENRQGADTGHPIPLYHSVRRRFPKKDSRA